eukprot:1160353-Pelagomonas_calceolata.AAC.12
MPYNLHLPRYDLIPYKWWGVNFHQPVPLSPPSPWFLFKVAIITSLHQHVLCPISLPALPTCPNTSSYALHLLRFLDAFWVKG